MTTCQIVAEIEAAGGVLALEGEQIRCNIPSGARSLMEVARANREGIREVLRQRLEAARPVVLGWAMTTMREGPRIMGERAFFVPRLPRVVFRTGTHGGRFGDIPRNPE